MKGEQNVNIKRGSIGNGVVPVIAEAAVVPVMTDAAEVPLMTEATVVV